jgi:UDP-glucose 4-epimerase
MRKRNESVLVTGGDGFIGRNLISFLKEGLNDSYRVFSFDLKTGGDVTDTFACRSLFINAEGESYPIKTIYHLSAQSFISRGEQTPYTDLDVNGKGTLNILKCAKEFDASLVYASTGSVYGVSDVFPQKESDPVKPVSNYGVTKRLGELYVQKFARDGVNCKAFRLSSVYGYNRGSHGCINAMVIRAVQGLKPIIHGDGLQSRDFISIKDAVRGIYYVMSQGKAGEIYNLGTGTEHTVLDVAMKVGEISGLEPIFKPSPKAGYDVPRNWFDTSKIKALGFTPKIGFEDGITALYHTYKGETNA